jgi:hypothetical protein
MMLAGRATQGPDAPSATHHLMPSPSSFLVARPKTISSGGAREYKGAPWRGMAPWRTSLRMNQNQLAVLLGDPVLDGKAFGQARKQLITAMRAPPAASRPTPSMPEPVPTSPLVGRERMGTHCRMPPLPPRGRRTVVEHPRAPVDVHSAQSKPAQVERQPWVSMERLDSAEGAELASARQWFAKLRGSGVDQADQQTSSLLASQPATLYSKGGPPSRVRRSLFLCCLCDQSLNIVDPGSSS